MEREKKKIYISLPVTSREDDDRNHSKSRAIAAATVKQLSKDFPDYCIINPFDVFDTLQRGWVDTIDEGMVMSTDIDFVMHSDGIYMCDGWRGSLGCVMEYIAAIKAGITIFGKDLGEPVVIPG